MGLPHWLPKNRIFGNCAKGLATFRNPDFSGPIRLRMSRVRGRCAAITIFTDELQLRSWEHRDSCSLSEWAYE
jgi:hypothetical protein